MGRIFLTSDLHIGHDREFIYKPRGFNSIGEHDKAIINRWNSVVNKDDTVYILGDLMLKDNNYGITVLSLLNGEKSFVRGNHDTDVRVDLYMDEHITYCGDAMILKYGGYRFYLSHYPTFTGSLEEKNIKKTTINLYGHTHQKTIFYEDRPYMYHVGCDSHNCTPVLLDDIIQDINNKIIEFRSDLQ